MNNRLKRHEKQAIKAAYQSHPFFALLYQPTKLYERQSNHIHLSAEEVFMECVSLIDSLRLDNLRAARNIARTAYDTIYCDLRDLSPEATSEEELNTATALIVYAACFLISTCSASRCNTLASELLMPLVDPAKRINLTSIKEQFTAASARIDMEALTTSFCTYWASTNHVSDDLNDLLVNLPEQSISDEEPKTAKSERFTQMQTIVYITESLDIALTDTNLTHIASLIQKLTGYKDIRPMLTNYKNGKKSASNMDLITVADALAVIKPKLSDSIRNGITE